MLEWSHLVIILGMAITTYLTRIIGFFLLRNRKLSTRTQFVLDNIAGCVMLSIIAPVFVSGEPATLLGLIGYTFGIDVVFIATYSSYRCSYYRSRPLCIRRIG